MKATFSFYFFFLILLQSAHIINYKGWRVGPSWINLLSVVFIAVAFFVAGLQNGGGAGGIFDTLFLTMMRKMPQNGMNRQQEYWWRKFTILPCQGVIKL